jgi:DNA-binding transcriptional ArsR family regulator
MKHNSYENFFTHFSNKTKLAVILSLIEKPLSVNEIAKKTSIEQSNISHSLKSLTECHILECKQEGKKRIYSLNKKVTIPMLNIVKKHIATNCCGNCNQCSKEAI